MAEQTEGSQLLQVSIALDLNAYLSSSFPWLPTRMDMSKIPNSHLYWGQASDQQVETFLEESALARYERVAALYAAEKPLPVFSFQYASQNLDLVSGGKEAFVLFGLIGNPLEPAVDRATFAYIHSGRDIWVVSANV